MRIFADAICPSLQPHLLALDSISHRHTSNDLPEKLAPEKNLHLQVPNTLIDLKRDRGITNPQIILRCLIHVRLNNKKITVRDNFSNQKCTQCNSYSYHMHQSLPLWSWICRGCEHSFEASSDFPAKCKGRTTLKAVKCT